MLLVGCCNGSSGRLRIPLKYSWLAVHPWLPVITGERHQPARQPHRGGTAHPATRLNPAGNSHAAGGGAAQADAGGTGGAAATDLLQVRPAHHACNSRCCSAAISHSARQHAQYCLAAPAPNITLLCRQRINTLLGLAAASTAACTPIRAGLSSPPRRGTTWPCLQQRGGAVSTSAAPQ